MKIMIITEHYPPKLGSASERLKNISKTFRLKSTEKKTTIFIYNSKEYSQNWKRSSRK